MTNIDIYNNNLAQRLDELRRGDRANDLHQLAITEGLIFAQQLSGNSGRQRILDMACGLGFVTSVLSSLNEFVVGIDTSQEAINLAQKEHPNVQFLHSSAEDFPSKMTHLGIDPFDHVILNMVLHSVDDNTAINMLLAAKQCLKPGGAILILVPTPKWLIQKLIDHVIDDKKMDKEVGIPWVHEQMQKRLVQIPYKIHGGLYYPQPLEIYNRSLADYGNMLLSTGFSVKKETKNVETLPYWTIPDYTLNANLKSKNRELLISFS